MTPRRSRARAGGPASGGSRTGGPPAARWGGRVLLPRTAEWAALFVLWLWLAGTTSASELVAGAAAAAIGTVASAVVRHAGGMPDHRFRIRWVGRATGLPARVVADFARVLVALWRALSGRRRPAGTFRAAPFRSQGPVTVDRARRAVAIAAGSLAPNEYVIDVDPETELILVHQLVPLQPTDRAAEAVSRERA